MLVLKLSSFPVSAGHVRYGEFGQAVLSRLLDGSSRRPPMYDLGFLREEQRDVAASLEEKVYKHWDTSDMAPARRRTVETLAEPTLEFLSWVDGAPAFPEMVLQKFAEGTSAHAEVQGMKKELLQAFPDSCRRTASASGEQGGGPSRNVRASGRPDFSIDGGIQPLNLNRVIEKEHIAASAFTVERTWGCQAKIAFVKNHNPQIRFKLKSHYGCFAYKPQ